MNQDNSNKQIERDWFDVDIESTPQIDINKINKIGIGRTVDIRGDILVPKFKVSRFNGSDFSFCTEDNKLCDRCKNDEFNDELVRKVGISKCQYEKYGLPCPFEIKDGKIINPIEEN
jgi:hypothetical protein